MSDVKLKKEIPVLEFREVDRERFDEVKSGVKSIETRANTEKYQTIDNGDAIMFSCGSDVFTKKVVRKYHWLTIEEMLEDVPLFKVMPDLTSIEQVRDRYNSYPSYDVKLKKYGILGLELS